MQRTWKNYLLYGSLAIFGGIFLFLLEETIRLKNTGFETKTLWNWMELLIIPAVLAGGAYFLNRAERNNERQIETDRQQEVALQSYLDRMADLLLKENLLTSESNQVRHVARTRALAVLRGLDSRRKALVLQFLREANLATPPNSIIDLKDAPLQNADLRGADFQGMKRNYACVQ